MKKLIANKTYYLLGGLLIQLTVMPCYSVELQGSVEQNSTRLNREQGTVGVPQIAPAPASAPIKGNLVDTSAFMSSVSTMPPPAPPLVKQIARPQSQPLKGAADKFDIGTDRNSRELTLAWDAWHKQLSQEIYARWSRIARSRGTAELQITVFRNRSVQVKIISSNGPPDFIGSILEVVQSLDGNPGLTFPSGSERQQVSFEAEYIAGFNVRPGYDWVKGDYEKVREDY